ncbi:MAG: hypothetical protein R3B41_04100 [Candidatus Doudnabacteria bacterium]
MSSSHDGYLDFMSKFSREIDHDSGPQIVVVQEYELVHFAIQDASALGELSRELENRLGAKSLEHFYHHSIKIVGFEEMRGVIKKLR